MRLGILGPLLVADDAGREIEVASRLRTLLAALLVRANHAVPVGELAEIVWDGEPPREAASTVRSYVMRLRRAVGPDVAPRILTRDPGYLCRVTDAELDVLRFGTLCRQGGAALRAGAWQDAYRTLADALDLWRGAALADVASQSLHREYVECLELERLQAVEWRVEAELRLGRHERLIPELHLLTQGHPLRERGHVQLMLALYRCGRQAEALHAYRRARRVLLAEVGVEPGPELQELQRRILNGDSTLAVPRCDDDPPPGRAARPPVVVPRQLPAAVQHFTGRAKELKTLSALLNRTEKATDAVVISAIGGTAGVGKTALAVHCAHQVAGAFPDGQLYANLRGFDPAAAPLDAGTTVRRFLDALGIPAARIPSDLDRQLALYHTFLADKRVLIVLDNARDVEQVRPLLPGAAGCRVLITSRNRLALPGVRPMILDLLTVAEARELLARRLGADTVSQEAAAADELIELCARLPLALNIAAARAALSSAGRLGPLVNELRDARQRLDSLATKDKAADVRSVFACSYHALDDAAARLFRLLTVHPGQDIGVLAAASLARIDPGQAGRLLAVLTAAHLLGEHNPGRYRSHDLLRAYAAEQSQRHDTELERHQAVERMLDHYLHTAHRAFTLLYPGWTQLELQPPCQDVRPQHIANRDQALAWYDAEHAVLVAIVAMAADAGFARHTWQLSWALVAYLNETGRRREWATVCEAALAAARRTDDLNAAAHAHRWLGDLLAARGDHAGAYAQLCQALARYEIVGDERSQANTHMMIGVLVGRQRRYAEALAHEQQALRLFRACRYPSGQGTALNAAGWFHAMLGDYQQALHDCQQAVDLSRDCAGDLHSEAAALDSIGFIHHQLHDYPAAIKHYKAALQLRRSTGDYHHQAEALAHLGDTYHACGDTEDARDAWRQALAILDDLDDPEAGDVRAKLAALDT